MIYASELSAALNIWSDSSPSVDVKRSWGGSRCLHLKKNEEVERIGAPAESVGEPLTPDLSVFLKWEEPLLEKVELVGG